MRSVSARELYSPAEIARAAGVAEIDVRAALGGARQLVPHAEAVRIGRRLVQRASGGPRRAAASLLFGIFADATPARRSTGVPFVVSTTLHASVLALAMPRQFQNRRPSRFPCGSTP
jgi:hypothetical protein